MIENYKSKNIFIKLNKELNKSKFYRDVSKKVIDNKLYQQISKSKEIKSIGDTLIKAGILQKRTHNSSSSSSSISNIIRPPPLPSLSSSNFPTTATNNLFSSIFCKNILENNGFIQKADSTFNNLPVYKTETTSDENTCLNNCKNDPYCSSYNFIKNKSSLNCLLYNQVPTSISNNDININAGYKNTLNYDFNNLNTNQKNVIRNDCINNYLNNNYNTTNLNYIECYSLGNDNSELNFSAQCLANMYEPLNKIKTNTSFTNIDNNLIDSITDKQLNNFTNNYTGYLQTQIGILNTSNSNPINNIYNETINIKTDIKSNDAKNNLLGEKSITSESITQSINGDENNIIESFRNNYIIESSNIDKYNSIYKSNSINFYLFIFIVILFFYIIFIYYFYLFNK
jgi:hypothetical protein